MTNKHLSLVVIVMIHLLNTAVLQPVGTADTVILNGRIYTGEWSTLNNAIAIRNGKIISVGDENDLANLIGPNTETIDVMGRIIIPGFVDNHNHIFEARSGAAGICIISPHLDITNEARVQAELQKCKNEYMSIFGNLDNYNGWITGAGWNIEELLKNYNIDSLRQKSPIEFLDEAFPNNPVVLMERSSHSVWVNSLALDRTSSLSDYITQGTDPTGGRIIRRSSDSKEIGILYDSAGDAVLEAAWILSNTNKDEEEKGLLAGLKEAAAVGITTIGDGRMYWKRGWMDTWSKVLNNNKLTARVSVRPWVYPFGETMARQINEFRNIKNQYNDVNGRIIVNQVKMYSDGIVINQSAKSSLKYIKKFFPGPDFGFNYIPESDMKNWLSELDNIGYGAMIHVIGDKAATESLNAIQAARDNNYSKQKYILTHCELIDDSDFQRFRNLDVSADFQAGNFVENKFDFHPEETEKFFGHEMVKKSLPVQSIKNVGANVILSSDWDVGKINPLINIANALDINKFTSFEEALEAYTINSAKAMSLDSVTGSIAVGKSADLTVLDTTEIPSKSSTGIMRNILVYDTYLQGRSVFI